MEPFLLKSRFLSTEEKIILFGKQAALKMEAIKALDLDNYIAMFRAIYDGLQIDIPGLVISNDPTRVYVYCDLPAGSRYYAEQNTYSREPARTEVYDMPISYIITTINEFLIPFLKDCVNTLSDIDTDKQEAYSYYNYLGAVYNKLSDVILGGMFLNIQDGKVISVSSFNSLLSQVKMFTNQLNNIPISMTDAENIWFYTQFLIPKEATSLEYKPSDAFLSNVGGFLTGQRQKIIEPLSNLYTWAHGSNIDLVIGEKYFKFNGYHAFNNKQYLGMACNSSSPIYEQTSGAGSSSGSFTHAFEGFLYSNRFGKPEMANLFQLTSCDRHSYYTNKGSFIFVNADAITTTKAELSAGLPELVELDKEFFASIVQIAQDEETTIGGYIAGDIAKEKFRKREFSIKKEAFLSEKEAMNSRYISLKSSDNKLFVLTKTSLAREAARKMSITRKITVALQPVVDMAIRLFAATDMELGIADPEYRFIACSKIALNECPITSDLLISLSEGIEKNKPLSIKHNTTQAIDTIKSIYVDVNYSGSPFMAWAPAYQSRYRDNFIYVPIEQKKLRIFEYLYSNIISSHQAYNMSNIFSPSSGQLNIISLAHSLYANSQYSKYSEELSYLKYVLSYGRNNATGKQVYYMYTNNFIGDNQATIDEIEHNKKNEYISLTNNLVAATTAFTFSEPAINTLATLKRCKTFADYNTWFTEIKPELETRADTLFKIGDEGMYKTVLFMLDHFDNLLKGLVAEELQHLPKPKVRKKKEVAVVEIETETIDLMEELETEPRSEEEVSNTLHLLQCLSAIGENNGNTTT